MAEKYRGSSVSANPARSKWWRMAALFVTLPMVAQSGQAQAAGGVPAANPAVRTEHTPPRRPQEMKGVPRPEQDRQAPAQSSDPAPRNAGIAPQKTAEDVLAELVKGAGVIFVGQVYAIRVPEGQTNPGTSGGLHSSSPNVVEVEFRVDQGVRGPSVGDPYVLRESEDQWRSDQSRLPLHQRAIVFLYPPDKQGLSSPVGGTVGIIPRENNDQVDLTGLHALVEGTPANDTAPNPSATAMAPAAGGPANGDAPGAGQPPAQQVTDVWTASGEQTLISGTSRGGMPELDTKHAPFLAVLRDIYVLAAAEQPPSAPPKSGL